jgi:hypothetical protein
VIQRNLKAIIAFLAPTITFVVIQLQSSNFNVKKLATGALVSFLSAVVVWAVPNKPEGV